MDKQGRKKTKKTKNRNRQCIRAKGWVTLEYLS